MKTLVLSAIVALATAPAFADVSFAVDQHNASIDNPNERIVLNVDAGTSLLSTRSQGFSLVADLHNASIDNVNDEISGQGFVSTVSFTGDVAAILAANAADQEDGGR